MKKANLFEDLKKESAYALESKSRDLVFETFGSAKMARALGAISHDQFVEISRRLITEVVDHNPEWQDKGV